MREGECFLERAKSFGIKLGSGLACLHAAVENGCRGGLSADDCGMDTLAGERIDESGGIACEENAPSRNVRVAAQPKVLADYICRQSDAELAVRVVGEQCARDAFIRSVWIASSGTGASSTGKLGNEAADADVDVVSLGKEPAVAAADGGEVEDEIERGIARGQRGGKISEGNRCFQGETASVPVRLRR